MPAGTSVIVQFPGSPVEQFSSVATLTALRALASSAQTDGKNVLAEGDVTAGDGGGGMYFWSAASLAVDDPPSVVRPNDKTALQAGRWINVGLDAAMVGLGTTTARSVIEGGALYAGAYSVVGDNVADDTAAAQAFLDLCATNRKAAHFGSLKVKVTAALIAHNVPVIFDGKLYGAAGDPGFYPTGSGYTVLRMTGQSVHGSVIAIYGTGSATFDGAGAISADTRTDVGGVEFGDPSGIGNEFAGSTIVSVRCYKLRRFGVKKTTYWDNTALNITIEECGNASHYAYSMEAPSGSTCNESTTVRLQVEKAANKAIYIHSSTLSCTFSNIHSERATGVAGSYTWQLGGDCSYHRPRLNADNPTIATALIKGQGTVVDGLRAEGDLKVYIDATGGTVSLTEPFGTLRPFLNQNGRVSVSGGRGSAENIDEYWLFSNVALSLFEGGFTNPDRFARCERCSIATIRAAAGIATAGAVFDDCIIAAGAVRTSGTQMFREVSFTNGTRFTPTGTLEIEGQLVNVDATSVINGNVTSAAAGGRLDGKIIGTLTVSGTKQWLASDTAHVTGAVSGWGFPDATTLMGTHREGMFCKNIGTVAVGGVEGWVFRDAAWRALGITAAAQATAVAAPAGGATVDTEARAQLAAVITALKTANLMAP
jgi:hypothetical protein